MNLLHHRKNEKKTKIKRVAGLARNRLLIKVGHDTGKGHIWYGQMQR
jgi:hypothetical protein